jgi:hypothetical protein
VIAVQAVVEVFSFWAGAADMVVMREWMLGQRWGVPGLKASVRTKGSDSERFQLSCLSCSRGFSYRWHVREGL